LKKVWQTYLWLAKKFPKDIKIIDGEGTEKEVFERAMGYIRPLVLKGRI